MKLSAMRLRRCGRGIALAVLICAGIHSGHGATRHTATLPRSDSQSRGTAPPLRHISQVRSLSPEQAARHVPVKLSGVVTAMPGYKNSFFLQDVSAGISVDRTDNAEVRPGDRVELTGTSGPGLFAPVVLASYVRVTGHAPPPRAPRKTIGDLFGGVQDSQWIEMRGVVRSAKWTQLFDRSTLLLGLQQDGGSVDLLLQDKASLDIAHLIDSVVRVRGVCASSGNDKRQFIGSALLVPHRDDLTVERPVPSDPFAAPVRPVRDILKLGRWQHRVKIAGVVTSQIPGEAIYLQDGSDGIRVETESTAVMPPGTPVEAVGFPGAGEHAPILESGLVRKGGRAAPVVALPIEAGNVITRGGQANYDQQLVQLQGKLIEEYREWDQRVLILASGNQIFEARLPVSVGSRQIGKLPEGSVLSLTGICAIHVDRRLKPVSFAILLRSGPDIVILKQAPWWTLRRTLLLLAFLAGVTVVVALWVIVLRSRVEQQTRIIRESENRFRHLAEHDGLTGLLNRAAILSSLDLELQRALREKSTLTVVLADIDHFKQVNDVHGHLAGDAALRRFAEAITGSIRSYDSVGRYGGEEFLLVLPGISSEDAASRLAAIHCAISNLLVHDGQAQFRITCSLGAVLVDKATGTIGGAPGESKQHILLAAADQALYEAKDAGRNRVVYRSFQTEYANTS